jgi:multidrug efflux system membrane fusion protein
MPDVGSTIASGESARPVARFSARQRRTGWIAGLLALAALVIGAVYLSRQGSTPSGGGGRAGGRGAAATTVGIAKAAAADLAVDIEALGTVTPAATVTVKPQVSGLITQVLYQEGQLVRKGQPLATIDPRPYQAALLQAKGALARDRAQLANAKLQLARYNALLREDSIARQDRDTQAALVGQLGGSISIDRGQVQQAQINLGFTRIVAPVTGRVGLRTMDVGNYIGAGDSNGVAVITTLQPIDVEFAVPQQQAPAIRSRIGQGAVIPAIILDSTRSQILDRGRFSTLDNQVDTTTGTIKGKARVPNVASQLYPSQFVNVRLTVNTIQGAVTVPPSAVRTGPDGSFVWILKPDRSVTERKVTTGVAAADKVQVLTGLALGETVITEGADRLTEGGKVALPGDQPPARGAGARAGRGQGRSRAGRSG